MNTIKKYITIVLILATGLVFYNFYSKSHQPVDYATEIIGTWILNDDHLSKSEFKSNNKRIDSYEGIIIDNSTYSITGTCNGESLSINEYFLKSVDTDDNFTSCEIINNIHTDSNGVKTLSLTSERGELITYTKQ